jgi:transposase-like protein
MSTDSLSQTYSPMPDWVPDGARRYLAHVEAGRSIRSLAREAGCHASTVLRQVRRYETRRDDLLIDLALRRLGDRSTLPGRQSSSQAGAETKMTANDTKDHAMTDETQIRKEAPRILRRLNETGACLAIARDMEKAVVVRDTPDGRTIRTAVLERPLAEALALKDWIAATGDGRIRRYRITAAGRMALKRLMAEEEALRVGMGETADPFSEQHRDWARRNSGDSTARKRGIRYNAAESPIVVLSRRKDADGKPFLSPDLVAVGERLREDFELAQLGPRITQNWDRFLTGGGRSDFNVNAGGGGSAAARDRVAAALSDLGPGLGDVVLRSCCFLEGMEAVERRMGWSARSGKIVLRIALLRLKSHYDVDGSNWSPLIG